MSKTIELLDPPYAGIHAPSARLARNASHFPCRKIAKVTGQKIAFITIVCLGLWIGGPPTAKAALYADGTTSAQTLAFGAPFAGRALAFRINVPGVGTGRRDASATFVNSRHAITAAHTFTDLLAYNPNYEVADGTNYFTDRGNVVTVTSILIHPSLDLAILKFAAPFFAAPDQIIGTAVTEEITISAGFGYWGTPSTGLGTSRDGGLRAWDATIQEHVIGRSEPYYQSTYFGTYTAGLSLNGRAANFDSGGPVFNTRGDLIGINDSATSIIATIGSTTYLRLGEPSTKAWIEANTALPAALPDLRLAPAPTGPAMRLTWNTDATGYRLQSSETGSGWTDLGPLITAPGTLDDPMADRPRRFYRLAKP